MEPDKALILAQAQKLYTVALLQEITIGNSGSYIFEVASQHKAYILRATLYTQTKQAHLAFESDWMEYLATQMDGIAKPVRSVNNRLFEVIETGDTQFLLSLQEKARGSIVDVENPNQFNESLFLNLGALMGRMHKLTKEYKGNVICPEFAWNGPNFWRKDIAILDDDILQAEKRLLSEINRLPINKDTYGIVHFDIHTDNFLVEGEHITLIDFDTCQLNWYAADIASAIFFMVLKGANPLKNLSETARSEFAETHLTAYLQGYLQTNAIDEYWIDTFDLFMKYQMIDEYVAAQSYWPKELSHRQQWYMDWHKDRIIHNLPYVSIDYKKVIRRLSGN